jgi:DNA-directed RNA polymerase subunit E'/Rpb7
MQQQCNNNATTMQPQCNNNATTMQPQCNKIEKIFCEYNIIPSTDKMATTIRRPQYKKDDGKNIKYGVYTKSMLTMKAVLHIQEVGKNIKDNLEKKISKNIEGKCIKEGYIQPKSTRVISYSGGMVMTDKIEFQVVIECMVTYPMEGMRIECITKTITKAGIHAEVVDRNGNIPIIVFIARDHHFNDAMFSQINENVKIDVRVIGVRFELNDPYICVIGQLVGKVDMNGGGAYIDEE